MKTESFKKASTLLKRIEGIDGSEPFLMITNLGNMKCGESTTPDMVLERQYSAWLNEADSEALRKHIQKFLNSLKSKLQTEFDNLK